MQVILDAPVGAYGGGEGCGIGRQGRDEEPCFGRGFAGRLDGAARGNGDDAGQPFPFRVALGEPCGIGGADASLLDPAMAAIRLLVIRAAGDEGGGVEEQGGILFERPLVALERQNRGGPTFSTGFRLNRVDRGFGYAACLICIGRPS